MRTNNHQNNRGKKNQAKNTAKSQSTFRQFVERAREILFVKTSEFYGLADIVFPDTTEHFPALHVVNAHGLTIINVLYDGVRGQYRLDDEPTKNETFVLRKGDVLALKIDGGSYLIEGPARKRDAVYKALAETRLNARNILGVSNSGMKAGQDELIRTIRTGGRITTDRQIGENEGLAAILFEMTRDGREKVVEIMVREGHINDPVVGKALSKELIDYRRQASGAFDKAQRMALEPWLEEARRMFDEQMEVERRALLEQTEAALKNLPEKTTVPVATGKAYTFFKSNAKSAKYTDGFGTFPIKPSRVAHLLVERGHSAAVLAAIAR